MPEAAPEPGYATFARFQRSLSPQATGTEVTAWWFALDGEEQQAWAAVEDWHPAIREQAAVLDAASEAMEKLTRERDLARREARKLSAALDVAIARLEADGHAAVREALERAGREAS